MKLHHYTEQNALITPDDAYRYTLSRAWGEGPRLHWVMLNPSTANAMVDDATIRKLVGFTMRLGHNGFIVTNLFAFRSRDPGALIIDRDVIGPMNDYHIQQCAEKHETIVAWGAFINAHPMLERRAKAVEELLNRHKLHCLGTTKSGAPRHPLMAPYRLVEGPLPVYQRAA